MSWLNQVSELDADSITAIWCQVPGRAWQKVCTPRPGLARASGVTTNNTPDVPSDASPCPGRVTPTPMAPPALSPAPAAMRTVEPSPQACAQRGSSDDPTRYRDAAEVESWEKRDPIDRMRRFLEKHRLWDAKAEEAELAAQNELVTREIQEAEKAPPPALDSIVEDVKAALDPALAEQLDEVRPFFEEGKTAEGAFPL